MKTILRHIISFSMILILLVSALQVSLYKMECIMSGNVTLSLSEFDSCHKTSPDETTISKKCCNFNDITFDFDYDTNVNLKTFKATIPTSFLSQQILALKPSVILIDNFNNYTTLPPPGGIELLKRVQVFRL